MFLASRRLCGNGPHLAWRGEPPGFSRVGAGPLDLRPGPQGPALVASGKASPHASCSGPLGFLYRRCRGLRPCVESVPESEVSSPVLIWILEYFWSLPRGVSLFLELGQVLSTYDGDLRDPLLWPQERPVPMRIARGPLGFPLPLMPGPKILCGVGAGT